MAEPIRNHLQKPNRDTQTSTRSEVDCEKCLDEGWIDVTPDNHDGAPIYKPCPCVLTKKRQERLKRLFRDAEVPRKYQAASFDNFERELQPKAFDICKRYAEEWGQVQKEGRFVFMFGDVGTGKTHLGYAILNHLLQHHGTPCLAARTSRLMNELRPQGDGQETARERLMVVEEVDFLLLDELGAEKRTDWVGEQLDIIINTRMEELRPTVITSNLALDDMTDTINDLRIADRIPEQADMVKLTGESYRVKIAKRRRAGQ